MDSKTIVTVFVALMLLQCATCELPSISEFFSSLWSKTQSTAEGIKDRTKRQQFSGGDTSDEIHLSSNDDLPRFPNKSIKFDHMPTLANGHLGFTPFSDAIYLNGLYNGRGGDSHRAKIPPLIMGEISLGDAAEERKIRTKRTFTLNAETGVFSVTIDSDYLFVLQQMYVHQKYDKVFVVDIYARAKPNTRDVLGGTLTIKYQPDSREEDLTGFRMTDFEGDSVITASTKTAEEGSTAQKVSYIWTDPESTISVRSGFENRTFLMAIDQDVSRATNEFKECLKIVHVGGGPHKLLTEHENAWRETWSRGKIEAIGTGDRLVSKLIQFSQYYLISNLPALNPNQPPKTSEFMYGVGRQSLGKGSRGRNQQGHVFWDSEVYILPAILPTQPELAKKLLEYRPAFIQQAKEYAEATGYHGYRFPWESAHSGYDVTPAGTCDSCRDRQIHIGAGISWAIRQYFSLTRDPDYLKSEEYRGCDMAINIAKFYAGAVHFDNNDGRYHLRDVMGPDDFHDHVNNNAYTNAAASLAIHWGRYMACMCRLREQDEVTDKDISKALHLKLPFDNMKRIHHQFDGYQDNKNETVKQADAVLLGYPLNWNMSDDIQRNDLFYYERLMSDITPAMTYSFMMVGWKFVKEYSRVRSYFDRSYQDYVIQPFKVWREYPDDDNEGTVNFLPGMGGFLQSIIYGFAGVRIRPEMLEFHNPMVPFNLEALRFHGFHYLGANLTFTIFASPRRVEIDVHSIGDYPLVLVKNHTWGRGSEESMNPGVTLVVENAEGGFFIYSQRGTSCDHPRDYIYMPWGYSPFINVSNTIHRPLSWLSAVLYNLAVLCLVVGQL